MAIRVEGDPWAPGLTSEIPARLMPLATHFRAENAEVSYREALELKDLFGLPLEDLATFNAERLVIHHLLVRVTADFTQKDGPAYADLGISVRGMVDLIFQNYAKPKLAEMETLLTEVRTAAQERLTAELDASVFSKPAPVGSVETRGFLGLFRKRPKPRKIGFDECVEKALLAWKKRATETPDAMEQACLEALDRVVSAQIAERGRLIANADLIAKLAMRRVSNTYGSDRLGDALVPIIDQAAKAEGLRRLPIQEKPVIMNVKGASASGKSTIRAQQRKLAERIGVPWEDFALISPDYWRKYLLEYESLGDDHKYGAMLTGRELEIIDKKLDRYMADKAAKGGISHLLVDRFRFDSFATEPAHRGTSRLLSRFGHTVYLFFMVTPPEATVERAWLRGLSTGRFKAVDDLLYHNVEAYTGMPQLFFSWALSNERKVHFEFLDNSVKRGDLPRTIAFGWNDDMVIVDLDGMKNIDRFKQIDVDAERPDDVYVEQDEHACAFLRQCVERTKRVRFADQVTGEVTATVLDGKIAWYGDETNGVRAMLDAFGLVTADGPLEEDGASLDIAEAKRFTVGAWGP
ncbi:MAG: zeta toxin family protein [Pseudomonadota bacterium]